MVALTLQACDGQTDGGSPTASDPPASEASSASPPATPSGPAAVFGTISVNGEPVDGSVALAREGEDVPLEDTGLGGFFDLTEIEPGVYRLFAGAVVEIFIQPGDTIPGPGTDEPCHAESFTVDNITFEIGGRLAIDTTARSEVAFEVRPGDQLEMNVDLVCDTVVL